MSPLDIWASNYRSKRTANPQLLLFFSLQTIRLAVLESIEATAAAVISLGAEFSLGFSGQSSDTDSVRKLNLM